MGIRFRRRIRLAPGLHLNLSGSGVSLSAGLRGASLTVGRDGVWANVGIPGSGIYQRERIFKPASASSIRPRSDSAPTLDFDPILVIEPDGSLTLTHPDGTPLPTSTLTQLRKSYPGFFRDAMAAHVESYRAHIARITDIHLDTPAPDRGPILPRRHFTTPPPVRPALPEPGAFDRLLPWRARRLAAKNRAKSREHTEAMQAWELARQAHQKADEERRQASIEALASADSGALEDLLAAHLERVDWPRATSVSLEVEPTTRMVRLDIDLPEIEEMPAETRTAPKRQWRILVKPLSATEHRRQYARHVHGVVFRIIGEAFACLPTIDSVRAAGYSQRIDPATGHIVDDYLISLNATRERWTKINFQGLGQVDPVEALEAHNLVRSLKRNGMLERIPRPKWLESVP